MEAFLKEKMKKIGSVISDSSNETIKIGKNFAKLLKKGDVVGFYGNLGSGKTYFIKGIISNFKFPLKDIISPTFLIVKEYHKKNITIYHFDLYRKKDFNDLELIGYREKYLMDENSIILIEWADKIKEIYDDLNYIIKIDQINYNKRKIIIYKSKQII